MRLAFSPAALADLESIGDFIRDESPAAALRFLAELRARCARLLDAPHGGKPRPDLGEGLRSVPFGRYVIFYDVEPGLVIIQRVLHSARDIDALFRGD
jgi:toxin ParE1/3/4